MGIIFRELERMLHDDASFRDEFLEEAEKVVLLGSIDDVLSRARSFFPKSQLMFNIVTKESEVTESDIAKLEGQYEELIRCNVDGIFLKLSAFGYDVQRLRGLIEHALSRTRFVGIDAEYVDMLITRKQAEKLSHLDTSRFIITAQTQWRGVEDYLSRFRDCNLGICYVPGVEKYFNSEQSNGGIMRDFYDVVSRTQDWFSENVFLGGNGMGIRNAVVRLTKETSKKYTAFVLRRDDAQGAVNWYDERGINTGVYIASMMGSDKIQSVKNCLGYLMRRKNIQDLINGRFYANRN